MSRSLFLTFCITSSLVGVACSASPPPKDTSFAPPEDEWSRTPRSAEWLYATRDVSGTHEAECKAVTTWIDEEEKCNAGLCSHAKALSKDWLARCSTLDKSDVGDVKDHLAIYEKRAKDDLSSCGEEAEKWLHDGCGECVEATSRWATTCGPSDGSPLILRMLERVVERKTGKRASLDPRGCDALLTEVVAGGSCAQQFKCEEAAKPVDAYLARCSGDDRPTSLLGAVLALSIEKGALHQTKPLPVGTVGNGLTSRDLATALDDGSGAALYVCNERALDLASYVDKRSKCANGTIVFAKAFHKGSATLVRLGEIPHASDAAFTVSFPSLSVAGEVELRDAQAFAGFQAALTAAASAGKGAAGVEALVTVIAGNAARIRRAAAYREELTHADGSLASAFAALGAAKVKAARAKITPAELFGLVARSATRPFADVSASGQAERGAANAASTLELGDILPLSTAAYGKAFGPALTQAKLRKPDAKSQGKARSAAKVQAEACGAAEKRLSEAEGTLISCAFGVESCDDAKTSEAAKAIEDSRAAAENARRKLDYCATSAGPDAQDELTQAAATAGCLEPWWLRIPCALFGFLSLFSCRLDHLLPVSMTQMPCRWGRLVLLRVELRESLAPVQTLVVLVVHPRGKRGTRGAVVSADRSESLGLEVCRHQEVVLPMLARRELRERLEKGAEVRAGSRHRQEDSEERRRIFRPSARRSGRTCAIH